MEDNTKIPNQESNQVQTPKPVENKQPENMSYLTKLPDKYRRDFGMNNGKNYKPLDRYPFKEQPGYSHENPSPKSQEYMKNFNNALKKAKSDYYADENNRRVAELFDLDEAKLTNDEYNREYLAREYHTTPEMLADMGFDGDYDLVDNFFEVQNMLNDEFGTDFEEIKDSGYDGPYNVQDVRDWWQNKLDDYTYYDGLNSRIDEYRHKHG